MSALELALALNTGYWILTHLHTCTLTHLQPCVARRDAAPPWGGPPAPPGCQTPDCVAGGHSASAADGSWSRFASLSLDETLSRPDEWGRCVESTVGAHLVSQSFVRGYEVMYWRDNDDEIDFVLRKGDKLVAIEVKSNRETYTGAMAVFRDKFPENRRPYSCSVHARPMLRSPTIFQPLTSLTIFSLRSGMDWSSSFWRNSMASASNCARKSAGTASSVTMRRSSA